MSKYYSIKKLNFSYVPRRTKYSKPYIEKYTARKIRNTIYKQKKRQISIILNNTFASTMSERCFPTSISNLHCILFIEDRNQILVTGGGGGIPCPHVESFNVSLIVDRMKALL